MPNAMIEVIGEVYNRRSIIETGVEQCAGFAVRCDKHEYIFDEGGKYKGGKIVDCFVHPESSYAFMIVECNGVYFNVGFDNYSCAFDDELPFR